MGLQEHSGVYWRALLWYMDALDEVINGRGGGRVRSRVRTIYIFYYILNRFFGFVYSLFYGLSGSKF